MAYTIPVTIRIGSGGRAWEAQLTSISDTGFGTVEWSSFGWHWGSSVSGDSREEAIAHITSRIEHHSAYPNSSFYRRLLKRLADLQSGVEPDKFEKTIDLLWQIEYRELEIASGFAATPAQRELWRLARLAERDTAIDAKAQYLTRQRWELVEYVSTALRVNATARRIHRLMDSLPDSLDDWTMAQLTAAKRIAMYTLGESYGIPITGLMPPSLTR